MTNGYLPALKRARELSPDADAAPRVEMETDALSRLLNLQGQGLAPNSIIGLRGLGPWVRFRANSLVRKLRQS